MLREPCIWILDDDVEVQKTYEGALGLRFALHFFSTLASFVDALLTGESRPEAVISDLRLKDGSFLHFLSGRETHEQLHDLTVLVVSRYDDRDAMRVCFERGVKDYIVKPFSANEIVVKLERFMPKVPATAPREWRVGTAKPVVECRDVPWTLEPTALTVANGNNAAVQLTSKEFQIMAMLDRAPEHCLSKEEMMTRIWGDVKVNDKALDVHIGNLRRKIVGLGLGIRFVRPGRFALICGDDGSALLGA